MKKIIVLTLSALSSFLVACSGVSHQSDAVNKETIAPFPAAKSGEVRSVIYLPQLKDEQNAKVELIIGKDMLVDCNIHRLSGQIKQEDLKGWGYSYYVVENVGSGISTMMACPSDEQNKMAFVTMNNDIGLIRYNSKLPIVVYTPSNVQVKYRVWSAQTPLKAAIIDK
ncbi:ecotin [Orbus hercynius]|uniref:Ecotin n=1 Tax=Orbus hercynius TaxID=593135 RepID=A0A495RIP4_9GAMM|nr:serine protease inhibitor ecotin [Orbus hercynius]RKS87056.1 ecotin [Orbus hercynius]